MYDIPTQSTTLLKFGQKESKAKALLRVGVVYEKESCK